MGKTILEMIDIKKSFSGIYALSGINFSLEMGEVHALLGENGAGKSTLIKVLGGIYKPDSGTIKINGQEAEINGVSDAQEKGIGIIHQEIVLVPYLTVAQNLFLGREIKTKFGTVDMRETNRRAGEMLANLGVNIHPDTLVESLTIAQQQMVEIVKAVSFDGRIIVMDEPTSSLSNDEVEQLFGIIERLKAKQVSIIYISHRMEELFRISDRVTIIRDGAYVGTKKTSETNANELVAMMVGRELESFYARDYNDLEHAETALEVKNLTCEGVFSDISFRVRKGEILGFAGLVGAGRSEIMECIFGARKYQSGTILLNGKEVRFTTPIQAIKAGIGLVPEDRKKQGLVLGNTVGFNLTLASIDSYINGIAISDRKCQEVIDYYKEKLHIKAVADRVELVEAGSLSGGNQQKIVLGKWLAIKPDVLILDEPTRGVDVNAKFEIYSVINELAKAGIAVIMVSSELPEIINMCDNVCVIKAGKMTGMLGREELDQERIMQYAAGNSVLSVFTGNTGIIGVLVILCVVVALATDKFLTPSNIISVLRQISINTYIALGMTLIIILGHIDLAVGAIVAMSGTLTVGFVVNQGLPIGVAIAAGIIIGVVAGLIDGMVVSKFRVPAFIITMAMMNVCNGIAYVYSGGQSTRITDKFFIAIGTGYLFNIIPLPVVYMVILIIVFSFLLSKTKFGTYVYAIGGNREAARLSGVPIKKVEIIVFTLSGALAAFAGLVLASRMYSGQPSVGSGYEMDAIAACVLGGTSMAGGRGRISGTVFGAMVIGIISNGLNLIGVSSYWQLIVKGLIIACAVVLDSQKGNLALLRKKK